jgi:hypothetical protein
MDPKLQLTLTLIGLAILLFFALSQYGTWIALRSVSRNLTQLNKRQKAMKLQIGSMIGMLLKAGFKRGVTVDWDDDLLKTRVKGSFLDTVWDWKLPENDG